MPSHSGICKNEEVNILTIELMPDFSIQVPFSDYLARFKSNASSNTKILNFKKRFKTDKEFFKSFKTETNKFWFSHTKSGQFIDAEQTITLLKRL